MKSAKVLIIEDDPSLSRVLKDNLRHEGYEVQAALDGLLGLELVTSFTPDLILLDIMLPTLNGFAICQRVREIDQITPILMLTAKGEEEDIIRGLNLGANDYITKPFQLQPLLARIKTNLRAFTHQSHSENIISIGDFQWHTQTKELKGATGEIINLQPKERDLLAHFITNPDRIFTRDQLLNAVWGHTFMLGTRSVDRCVTSLRKKIKSTANSPEFIKTVRGVGYRLCFESEVT